MSFLTQVKGARLWAIVAIVILADPMVSGAALLQRKRFTPIVSLNLDPQESANTALRIAARSGLDGQIDYAIGRKGQINSHSSEGTTALMYAAQGCYTHTVKHLLSLGAEINARDKHGRTALMLAIRGSCIRVVRILLHQRGIDVKKTDRRNRTVLDIAISAAALDVDGPSVEILSLIRAKMSIPLASTEDAQ